MAYLRRYNISEANSLTKPLNLQDITITPSKETQTIIHDSSLGYNGLGVITVEAVDASIDPNIKPGNIVEGVEILGVIGTNSGSGGIKKILERDYNSLGEGDLAGVSRLSGYCFYRANNLMEITIPDSILTIGNHCFEESGIQKIEIPETVQYLNPGSLFRMPQLEELIFRNPRIEQVVGDCTSLNSVKIYNTEYIDSDWDTYQTGKPCFNNYNSYKNGSYLGNDENPYLAFIKSNGNGCEIAENALIARYAISQSNKKVAIPANVIMTTQLCGGPYSSLTLYCEAPSKPESWDNNWNNWGNSVVWGAKKKNYNISVNGSITETFNSVLLTEKPTTEVPENYFWDYYSSTDFTDENIIELPYYADSDTTVYARFELDPKADGKTLETAFRLSTAKDISFVMSAETGIVYFIFTPSETGTYRFDFEQDYSKGGENYDSGVGVFDENFNNIFGSDDDSSYGDNEPAIGYDFTAGNTYYFKFTFYGAYNDWYAENNNKPNVDTPFIMHSQKL